MELRPGAPLESQLHDLPRRSIVRVRKDDGPFGVDGGQISIILQHDGDVPHIRQGHAARLRQRFDISQPEIRLPGRTFNWVQLATSRRVDARNARTRIRDVWDVAIMTYGGFPIFTRRYAFHGLENFAFDLLLGKPCLIVAHHDFFKDGGVRLIELIEKIAALNCTLCWRPLGDIIRRACRCRANGISSEEVEMYGDELIIGNVSDQTIEVKVRKRTSQDDLIAEIVCDEKAVVWATEDEHLLFGERIQPHSEKCFRVVYQEHAHAGQASRSLRFEMAVAARRVLSEFRDVYLSRSDFLSSQAGRLKNALKKAI